MSRPRILIVHPDSSSLATLSSMLGLLGHVVEEAANDRAAVRRIERGGIDLVLAGIDPTDAEVLELLSYVQRKHRRIPVILLFLMTNLMRANEALRMGARSVLRHPVPAPELRAALTQALTTSDRPAQADSVFRSAVGNAPKHQTYLGQGTANGASLALSPAVNGNGDGWPDRGYEPDVVVQLDVAPYQGTRIISEEIPPRPYSTRSLPPSVDLRPLREALEVHERRIIVLSLQAFNWNRQEAARVLKINRTTLYKKMKKYGLLVKGSILI